MDRARSPASPGFRALDVEPGSSLTRVRRLAALAEDLGAERIASDAVRLLERTAEGRFFVACVGQYKRGVRRR